MLFASPGKAPRPDSPRSSARNLAPATRSTPTPGARPPIGDRCACGGGCPNCAPASLDADLRATLERSYGADLGDVRLHRDLSAGLSSIGLRARAYAHGDDVFFAPGEYQPRTSAGRRLIAHEVAHVVQQRGGAGGAALGSAGAEREAGRAADSALGGGGFAPLSAVARQPLRAPMTLDEIRVRIAQIERMLDPSYVDPNANSSMTADEYAALEAEHMALQRQYSLTAEAPSASVAPARPPVSSSTPEPLTSSPEISSPEVSPFPEAGAPASEPLATMPEPNATMPEPLACEAAPSPAAAEAVCVAPENTTLAPGEMVDYIVTQRGFSSAGRPVGGVNPAPAATQGPLGPGYETNAMIQIVDGEGNAVAVEMAQYSGGSEHAEAQAIAALRARLAGRPIPGGRLVVAVDQMACPDCMARLRALAQELGLESFEVWGPGRTTAGGRAVSPKWAARSATHAPARPSANEPPPAAYRMQPQLMQGETIGPAPAESLATPVIEPPGAAPPLPEALPIDDGAAPVAPEPPVVPEAENIPGRGRPSGGSGWGGAALAVAPLALGFVHSWAESRRMRDQVAREGFAPVGPEAHADQNLALRLGNWLLDPFLGATTPVSQRFHMPTWRQHVREKTAGKDRITFSWETPGETLMPGHVRVEYQRGADGRWSVAPGQSFPEGFTPPDLNAIIDSAKSDSDVEWELACSAGQCA
jgi:hypothetical protein